MCTKFNIFIPYHITSDDVKKWRDEPCKTRSEKILALNRAIKKENCVQKNQEMEEEKKIIEQIYHKLNKHQKCYCGVCLGKAKPLELDVLPVCNPVNTDALYCKFDDDELLLWHLDPKTISEMKDEQHFMQYAAQPSSDMGFQMMDHELEKYRSLHHITLCNDQCECISVQSLMVNDHHINFFHNEGEENEIIEGEPRVLITQPNYTDVVGHDLDFEFDIQDMDLLANDYDYDIALDLDLNF